MAEIECTPAGACGVSEQPVAGNVIVHLAPAPSSMTTSPLGVPAPGATTPRLIVTFADCPNVIAAGAENVSVVAALFTICVVTGDCEARLLASPP